MVRTAQAAEVSSTTSIPGPCSGPQTTPAILEYQPAEKIRECACIVSKIAKCAHIVLYCAHIVPYVKKCALIVAIVLICKICALLSHYVHTL